MSMRGVLLGATFLVVACDAEPETLAPAGHHVVVLDTDAIVPNSRRAGDVTDVPALFDRLEVAVLTGDGDEPEPSDVRVFDVTEATFSDADGGATFTIARESVPDATTFATSADANAPGPRVRARLYRTASVYEGIIRPETMIEVWARLPQTPRTGSVETTIYLLTDDVGAPRGTAEAPLDPSLAPDARVRSGRPSETLVGTWPGGSRTSCAVDARDGRVCVPGGAYWMGNPLVRGTDFVESDRQRLVVLRPFYVDPREVTVGELRDWLATEPDGPIDVRVRNDADASDPAHYCTYTDEPGDGDTRPVNCVSWATAQRYCEDHGGSLLSESQFEYVSGALRSALYIWGTDEAAICGAAVWGRGARTGTAIAEVGSDRCLPDSEREDGPLSLTASTIDVSRVTDRIALPGGTVFDLAGNLQEWQSDYFSGQDGDCWKRPQGNVFYDPLCADEGVAGDRAVRGGSWLQDRVFLRAAYRSRRSGSDATLYDVGFRCAARDD